VHDVAHFLKVAFEERPGVVVDEQSRDLLLIARLKASVG
jgi:hypothetical protein